MSQAHATEPEPVKEVTFEFNNNTDEDASVLLGTAIARRRGRARVLANNS